MSKKRSVETTLVDIHCKCLEDLLTPTCIKMRVSYLRCRLFLYWKWSKRRCGARCLIGGNEMIPHKRK
jgi:hypothetical protein